MTSSSSINEQLKTLVQGGNLQGVKRPHGIKPVKTTMNKPKAVIASVSNEDDPDYNEDEEVIMPTASDDTDDQADAEVAEVLDDADAVPEDGSDDGADEEAAAPSVGEADLLIIEGAKCMRCGFLCNVNTRYYDECHFSKGNADCPAQYFKIAVGVNFEKASDALAEAMLTGDTDRLARINNKLADKDDIIKKRVFSMATKKLLAATAASE